jgi:hypothetical protein
MDATDRGKPLMSARVPVASHRGSQNPRGSENLRSDTGSPPGRGKKSGNTAARHGSVAAPEAEAEAVPIAQQSPDTRMHASRPVFFLVLLLMPIPPHLAGATFPAGPSRRRASHRGAMTSAPCCCRVAALASLLAVGAATAMLTFSLPVTPRASSTSEFKREEEPSVTRVTTAPPPPRVPSTPAPAARRRKREVRDMMFETPQSVPLCVRFCFVHTCW